MTTQTDQPPPTPAPASPTSPPPPPPPPTRRSVWTPKEKLVRVAWSLLAGPLWAILPAARPALIRAFGGRCGSGCRFARSVRITIPWHVRCGDRVTILDQVTLYGLGPITIGSDTLIDIRAHLCAGTHDMTDSTFPLLKTPITIGERCLIGADAYLAPNVTLGSDCRVHPRACVYKDFPGGTVLIGNPAQPTAQPSDRDPA